MISAGELRDRIVFQRRYQLQETDDLGQALENWQALAAPTRASVKPVSGGPEIVAGRLSGVTGYRIRLNAQRDLASLAVGDRAVDCRNASRIFVITSVLPSDRGDEIDITAVTGKPI